MGLHALGKTVLIAAGDALMIAFDSQLALQVEAEWEERKKFENS